MIVSVTNNKGGCGKTTTAEILAPVVRAAARVVSVVSIVSFIYSATNVVKICFNIPTK